MVRGLVAAALLCGAAATAALAAPQPPKAVVEAQDDIYEVGNPDNGSGPQWGYGNTTVVRVGERVFVVGLDVIPNQVPYNNVRWTLYERTPNGWQLQQKDDKGRTREPCPIACFDDGRVFISASPTLTAPDAQGGPAQPQMLQFSAAAAQAAPRVMLPVYSDSPQFNQHTYRGLAADGVNHELLDLQIDNYNGYYASFMDSAGKWNPCGLIRFTMGQYETPEPDRSCYPEVAIQGKTAYAMAVSDIVEPVKAWREYKFQQSGQAWDYVFRKLYLTWSPDVTKTPFTDFTKIADVDQFGGGISNFDMYVDRTGGAHLLWRETSSESRVHAKYFPTYPVTDSLKYAIVRKGKLQFIRTLTQPLEPKAWQTVQWARFHVTPDGRLFMVYYTQGGDATGKRFNEDRIAQILPGGKFGPATVLPFKEPFTRFDLNTTRAGCAPSNIIDIVGQGGARGSTMRYARVRLG